MTDSEANKDLRASLKVSPEVQRRMKLAAFYTRKSIQALVEEAFGIYEEMVAPHGWDKPLVPIRPKLRGETAAKVIESNRDQGTPQPGVDRDASRGKKKLAAAGEDVRSAKGVISNTDQIVEESLQSGKRDKSSGKANPEEKTG